MATQVEGKYGVGALFIGKGAMREVVQVMQLLDGTTRYRFRLSQSVYTEAELDANFKAVTASEGETFEEPTKIK